MNFEQLGHLQSTSTTPHRSPNSRKERHHKNNVTCPMHTMSNDITFDEEEIQRRYLEIAMFASDSHELGTNTGPLSIAGSSCNINQRPVTSTCDCDTCKAYNSRVDVRQRSASKATKALKHHSCPNAAFDYNDSLPLLKYVESLRVSVHSMILNKEGNKKVATTSTKSTITFFIEYNIPANLVSCPAKVGSKVNTGLASQNKVRMCSKKLIDHVVYFKQVSIHTVSNILDADLCGSDIIFRVCSRAPSQKGVNIIGTANFNMASFLYSQNFSCNLELPILMSGNVPIVFGSLKVSLQLGCGKIFFGKDFIEAISNKQECTVFHDISLDRDHCDSNEMRLALPGSPRKNISGASKANNKEHDKTTIARQSSVQSNKGSVTKTPTEIEKKILSPKKSQVTLRNVKIKEGSTQTIEKQYKQVLFGFIYIAQAQFLEAKTNPFLSCRPFGQDDIVVSNSMATTSNPVFNFQQRIPYVYDEYLIAKLRDNFTMFEFWEQRASRKSIVGAANVQLHQFYLAFRNQDILKYLERNKLPVIGADWWEPIVNPNTNDHCGQAQILVALGTQAQIDSLRKDRGFVRDQVRLITAPSLLDKSVAPVKVLKSHSVTVPVRKIDIGVQTFVTRDFSTMTDDSAAAGNNTQNMLDTFFKQLLAKTSQSHPTADMSTNTDNPAAPSTVLGSTAQLLDQLETALKLPAPALPAPANATSDAVPNTFKAQVLVEKALHLPTRRKCKSKKSKGHHRNSGRSEEVCPSTYVSFETGLGSDVRVTSVIQKNANPTWNWKTEVLLPVQLLLDSDKKLVFKVWKKSNNAAVQPNIQLDSIVGVAALDMTVLMAGLPSIQGWFDIVDMSSKSHGQIKINVTPMECLKQYAKSKIRHKSESASTLAVAANHAAIIANVDEEPGDILCRALKRKFTDLDEISARLRSRLSDVLTDTDHISDGDDEFERDINTLCCEDEDSSIDELDFAKEAHKVHCMQVTRGLELVRQQQQQDGASTSSAYNDSDSKSAQSSQMDAFDALAVDVANNPLDRQVVAEKQRIDSLLQKLNLITSTGQDRARSGLNGTKFDPILLSDSAKATSTSSDSSNTSTCSLLMTTTSRLAPDGGGNSS